LHVIVNFTLNAVQTVKNSEGVKLSKVTCAKKNTQYVVIAWWKSRRLRLQ